MTFKEIEQYCIDEGMKNAGKATSTEIGLSQQDYYKGMSLAFMWVAAQLQKANKIATLEEMNNEVINELEVEEAGGLSERIRKAMDAIGINQRDLARRVHVTEASMSRYVNGVRVPRTTLLAQIATELGVTMDWLMGMEK